MSYSTINKCKYGDCSICDSKDVACIKRKKDLICIPCVRRIDGKEQINKAQEKEKLRRGGNTSKVSSKTLADVRKLSDRSNKIKTKSDLLREADKAFSDYIKARDTAVNGTMYCPCCNKTFDSTGVDVNCMHFVDRDVYSLRFDELNAHMGHATCNRNQHYAPKGIEYQNFRAYLVKQITEEEVAIMELEHRKINRIEERQLKVIIEHYSQHNTNA